MEYVSFFTAVVAVVFVATILCNSRRFLFIYVAANLHLCVKNILQESDYINRTPYIFLYFGYFSRIFLWLLLLFVCKWCFIISFLLYPVWAGLGEIAKRNSSESIVATFSFLNFWTIKWAKTGAAIVCLACIISKYLVHRSNYQTTTWRKKKCVFFLYLFYKLRGSQLVGQLR